MLISRLGLPCVLLLVTVAEARAQPAFPGAEGMAGAITGGRGGQVIKVTTLDATGPGSLQAALDEPGPRIVVFAVSGVIEADPIVIPTGDVTIAGESAPGGGITIDGRLVAAYEYGTDNIIVRHVRVRPTRPEGPGEQFDAMQFSRASRVLLDHVSASFAVDETIDLFESNHVTVQWSTIESSDTAGHHPEREHNYGLIQGPDGGRASIHHNLFAHHKNRCPALATGPSEVRNNVVYNVRHGFVHHNPAAGAFAITGNSYIDGDDGTLFPFFLDDESGGADPGLRYFFADNFIDDPGIFTGIVDNPWAHPSYGDLGLPESYRAEAEPELEPGSPDWLPVTQHGSAEALPLVLACAGAWPRDVVTLRSVAETMERGGTWGSRVPVDLMEGLTPTPPPSDRDDDGIPDLWEVDHGLNPDDASDVLVELETGYSAIESYLQERAAQLVGAGCPGGEDGESGGDDGGSGGSGGVPGSSGGGSDGGSTGAVGGDTEAVGGDTDAMPDCTVDPCVDPSQDDTGGCSCRVDQPANLGFSLGLLVLLLRRRRS